MKLKNIKLIIVNLILSCFFSIGITYFYWKNSSSSLDIYNSFIYGDTINGAMSKSIDIKIIVFFSMLLSISFLILDYLKVTAEAIRISRLFLEKIRNEKEVIKKVFDIFFKISTVLIFSFFSAKLLSFLGFFDWNKAGLKIIYTSAISGVSLIFKSRAILASQFIFCLSPFLFITKKYHYNGEVFLLPESLTFLMVAIFLLITFITIKEVKIGKNFLTTSLIFFILCLRIGGLSFFYHLDEYHLGEMFTSYHQVFELNQYAYTEYIPTKGFMHIIIGFFNEKLFGGGYISIIAAQQITALLFGVLLIFLIRIFYNNEKTAFLLLLFLSIPNSEQYYPIIIGLLILSSKKVNDNSYNFLISYLYFSFVYFIYYNAFGIAFAVTLFPVVTLAAYSIVKNKYKPEKYHYFLFSFGVILFLLLWEFIFNSISYSIINSSSNLLYWGNYGGARSFLKSNLWLMLFFSILFFIYTNKIKIDKHNSIWISFLILFPFIIISYLEGRADGIFGRAKVFTLFYSFIVFSFAISRVSKLNKKMVFILTSISLVSFFINIISPFFNFRLSSFKDVIVDSSFYDYVDNSNIPKLGAGFINNERHSDIKNEFELVKNLGKNELFLIIDPYVTQSARYSIYNKKVPTKSHSILNISSLKSQADELINIKTEELKVIRMTDGVNRYHLFHKYIFDNDWFPIFYNGHQYFVSTDFFNKIEGVLEFETQEVDLDYYSTKNFGLLPIKWGSAFQKESKNLKSKMIEISPVYTNDVVKNTDGSYLLSGDDSYVVFDISDASDFIGRDLLTFDLYKNVEEICSAQLFWRDKDPFSESNSVVFNVSNGLNTVPVGMNLMWKYADKISEIRLDFDGCDSQIVKVNSIIFSDYNF